jgi:hypothetical protein
MAPRAQRLPWHKEDWTGRRFLSEISLPQGVLECPNPTAMRSHSIGQHQPGNIATISKKIAQEGFDQIHTA